MRYVTALLLLLALVASSDAQQRSFSIRLEMYNEFSQTVSIIDVPVPSDKFRRQFRALDVAYALGIGEFSFREKITVMEGLLPREVFAVMNTEDGYPPALWFEYYVRRGESSERFFSEPLEENDLRLR